MSRVTFQTTKEEKVGKEKSTYITPGFNIDFLLRLIDEKPEVSKCITERGKPCTPERAKELLYVMKATGETSV